MGRDIYENALDAEGIPCTRCGRCCLEHGGDLQASAADLARWQREAPWLLDHVDPVTGDLWLDPATGSRLARCPWLEQADGLYGCAIHYDRPGTCRAYPFSVLQAEFDECDAVVERPGGR